MVGLQNIQGVQFLKITLATNKIDAIILDIEGTIGSKDFVKNTLFPYSLNHIDKYLENLDDLDLINELKHLTVTKKYEISQISEILKNAIQSDMKLPVLKKIQGIIWENAYKNNIIKSHLYKDAYEKICSWYEKYPVYIYSSGSVLAQKLYFEYNEYGNLSYLINDYFDTTVGPKKEAGSYEKILSNISKDPINTLFFTDDTEEYQAAEAANISVYLVDREEKDLNFKFRKIVNFHQLDF
jgi:enolase-phosphatase E1